VFIGIQVANWNEEHQRINTTIHYIERIKDELVANRFDIAQRAAYFEQTRSHGLAALQALENNHEDLGEQFLIDVYQTSQILPRDISRDSYNEILSIGANTAIPDIEIRKRLATYYSSITAQKSNIINITPYRETIRRNMPYTVQAAIRAACDDVVTTNEQGQHSITLPNSCSPKLTSNQREEAVRDILMLDIKKDLTRQLSNLDIKLLSVKLFNERTSMMIYYLEGIN